MRKFFLFVWEITKIVVISLAIILPVRYYLIQPFYVKGASMEPTFQDQEYLIVDEISYRFTPPTRGQVIVFRYPLDPQEYFIKRIIALPGESVQIKDGQVIIFNVTHPDGLVINETYLSDNIPTYDQSTAKLTLGPQEYFVLGDNRGASKDSRSFGAVNGSFITGKVLFRGWPLNKVTIFNQEYWPQYNN
ncbi:signal peptidase I [Candidatus Falkowbacteria bacterium]|uniref:Signal peptidase I n=1 Tax=Candidatus Falkowbacteria bacterium CG10_big_fil_rev_8_21_14_0_10_37_18 TaxID=1974562 RepID=A0A2H0V881_9BACT|nr:signal peptidase I [Candidatus Falkowbacteria bacterium]NCQ12617.1 signal peptidase I [Candidatus Falkowbacteria bacterium]OIO05768.1 MAG: signal peptidase I [Candidatus Falkowbacteria bacterium CG1_02_37_21]PIR95317.1 MAG: signal peptidase I [Candidatus Falkowbacteria bacterium CG10_big_fil_rev_8_21_14_0_10_37_18]